MADLNKTDLLKEPTFGYTFGNSSDAVFDYPASTFTIAQNDVLYLGVIPAGTVVTGASLQTGALGASVTVDMGFAPVNAAAGPTADDDYFIAAADHSAAVKTVSAAFPITFTEDVYITATFEGANPADDERITAVVNYVNRDYDL